MPETAVEEDGDLRLDEDDVGPPPRAGDDSTVDPEAEPATMKEPTNGHLARSVAAPSGQHAMKRLGRRSRRNPPSPRAADPKPLENLRTQRGHEQRRHGVTNHRGEHDTARRFAEIEEVRERLQPRGLVRRDRA